MSDDLIMVTDATGVRDFRNLRRLRNNLPLQQIDTSPATGQTNVIVEITTTISDDEPVTVRQVTLVAGAWEKVRDREIRRVGSGTIRGTTGTPVRTIATRVGSLGLCVRADE